MGNPDPVTFLLKDDAIKLREFVIGLTKAKRENIAITNVSDKKVQLLEKIGDTHENIHAAV